MDVNNYGLWTLIELRSELRKRGAKPSGRKHELVERYSRSRCVTESQFISFNILTISSSSPLSWLGPPLLTLSDHAGFPLPHFFCFPSAWSINFTPSSTQSNIEFVFFSVSTLSSLVYLPTPPFVSACPRPAPHQLLTFHFYLASLLYWRIFLHCEICELC